MKKKLLIVSLFLLLFTSFSFADYPTPTGFVNDYAGLLNSSDKTRLESLAREISEKAKIEISFVTMDAIPEGEDISLYTVELGHAWGVGKKGTDRGAVLLYKTGSGDGSGRQVYLATGYGLEGDVPDGVAGRILDQVTIPYLREGRVFEAFASTGAEIVRLVEPDVQLTGAVSPRMRSNRSSDQEVSPFGLIFMLIIVAILMSSRTGRAFLFGMLLSSMLGGRRGGGGGGFGGGFGGFGGGGFGGGGAGRSF